MLASYYKATRRGKYTLTNDVHICHISVIMNLPSYLWAPPWSNW